MAKSKTKDEKIETEQSSEQTRYRCEDTSANFLSGIADSFANAFSAFSGELNQGQDPNRRLTGGYVRGVLAGNERFFRGLANVSSQAYDDYSRDFLSERRLAEKIDYELLAKLVAKELKD